MATKEMVWVCGDGSSHPTPHTNRVGWPTKFHYKDCHHLKGAYDRSDGAGRHIVPLTVAKALELRWERCRACGRGKRAADESEEIREKLDEEVEGHLKKSIVEVKEAYERSLSKRKAPLPPAKQVSTVVYVRDAAVIALVLKRAENKCEMPNCTTAVFKTKNGRTYLEVHHVKPLGESGPDTIENCAALCPNCHRQIHYGATADQSRRGLRVAVTEAQMRFDAISS